MKRKVLLDRPHTVAEYARRIYDSPRHVRRLIHQKALVARKTRGRWTITGYRDFKVVMNAIFREEYGPALVRQITAPEPFFEALR